MATKYLKYTSFALSVTLSCGTAYAQNSFEDSSESTSLTRYQVVKEGDNILKLQELEELEDKSKTLFSEGKCGAAAHLGFAESANIAANILRQTLEPFYSADRDDTQTIIRSPANKGLGNVERAANNLLSKRNETWFLEAKCYFDRGDNDEALTRLYRVLDHLDPIDDQDFWVESREMMWSLVGYEVVN